MLDPKDTVPVNQPVTKDKSWVPHPRSLEEADPQRQKVDGGAREGRG